MPIVNAEDVLLLLAYSIVVIFSMIGAGVVAIKLGQLTNKILGGRK